MTYFKISLPTRNWDIAIVFDGNERFFFEVAKKFIVASRSRQSDHDVAIFEMEGDKIDRLGLPSPGWIFKKDHVETTMLKTQMTRTRGGRGKLEMVPILKLVEGIQQLNGESLIVCLLLGDEGGKCIASDPNDFGGR